MQSVVEELKAKVESTLNLPPGYYITYGGAFENLTKAKQRLSIAVPISLLLIFLMLFFCFEIRKAWSAYIHGNSLICDGRCICTRWKRHAV